MISMFDEVSKKMAKGLGLKESTHEVIKENSKEIIDNMLKYNALFARLSK